MPKCDYDQRKAEKEVDKLAFEIPKQPYSGRIGETMVGTGTGALKLGGEDSYSFHLFEGSMTNAPRIAMEIWDYDPSEEWPAAATEPFRDVLSSPEAWAKKCVDQYGADMIVVQLKSTDPNGMDRSSDEAAEVAKKVCDAVNVPLAFWGTANNRKDEEVLKKISEVCEGKNVSLGPVEEGNHKGVGASALGYGHTIIASSPIDVNLAKQLNILLGNLGIKPEKIVVDPTTGGLGYGLEYSYSVMERIMMAALTQEDDKLQLPMINTVGNEVWKCKEAKLSVEEAPELGDPERRAIMMETVAAVSYLLAGSNVVVLRHPESVRMIRSFIDLMITGGMARDVEGITKRLEARPVDLAALSPEPNLDFAQGEETPKKKAEKPKQAKPKKTEKPKVDAEVKVEAKAEVKAKTKAKTEEEAKVKAKAEEEAKVRVKAEEDVKAKAKAEEEAKAKARAEEEAKVKAEAKVDAEAKAKADEVAKREAEEEALRQKRAQEQEERLARKAAGEVGEVKDVSMTAAKVQKSKQDKLLAKLKRGRR